MNTISEMLSNLNKPVRKKTISLRFNESELNEIDLYCRAGYLSYSEVMRAAIKEYLQNKK